MNVVYSFGAYPFGKLADKVSRFALLAGGLAVLIAADVLLALAGSGPVLWAGVALWGLHMAMTQGLLSAMVAGTAPADLRGTAFGVFNLASGIALLLASGLAGWLWDAHGPSFTFGCGAVLTAVALLGLLARRPTMS
jgi:MFS family permease